MPAQSPKPLDRILVTLKLKKDQPALTREQAFQAWPVRNPDLQVHTGDDGLVTVELPRRKDWMGGVLGVVFSVPQSKPVQLDEVGSFVWGLCDGEHTVTDIATELVNEYKLNRREVEVSLTQYLQTLGKRGMVGFAVPAEVAEAAGLAGEVIKPAEPETEPDEGTSGLPPVTTDVNAPASPAPSLPTEQPDDQEHPGGL
jgi:hypothetical protein